MKKTMKKVVLGGAVMIIGEKKDDTARGTQHSIELARGTQHKPLIARGTQHKPIA